MPSLADRWRNLGRSDIADDWNDALPVVGPREFYRGVRDVTVTLKTKRQAQPPTETKSGRRYLTAAEVECGIRMVLDEGRPIAVAAEKLQVHPKTLSAHITAERKRRAAAKSTDRVEVSPAIAPEPCTPEVNVLEAVESAQGYTCHRCGGDQERMENYDEVCSLCQEEEREESVQEAPAHAPVCADCGGIQSVHRYEDRALCFYCYAMRHPSEPIPAPIPLPPAITCYACACDVLVEDVLCCDCTDELHRAEVDADRQADAILESVGCILGAMTLDQYHSVSVNMRHAIDVLMGVMP